MAATTDREHRAESRRSSSPGRWPQRPAGLLAGAAEAAAIALCFRERFGLGEFGFNSMNDAELGDPVTRTDLERLAAQIRNHHFEFATVAGIDDTSER